MCWWTPGVVVGVAWGQEDPSGQWRTDQTSSFLLPQWLPVWKERARKEKWGGRGLECKGKMISWGYAKHTMVWLLCQLATPQKTVHVWEKVNDVCDKVQPCLWYNGPARQTVHWVIKASFWTNTVVFVIPTLVVYMCFIMTDWPQWLRVQTVPGQSLGYVSSCMETSERLCVCVCVCVHMWETMKQNIWYRKL